MPAERVSMRRLREVLRLKHEGGASDRQIARSLSLARSTVALTLERAAAAGLRWPLPATLTDRVLEAMLYAGAGRQQGERRKAEPDWAHIHHELRRPGVTLMLSARRTVPSWPMSMYASPRSTRCASTRKAPSCSIVLSTAPSGSAGRASASLSSTRISASRGRRAPSDTAFSG